jgi:RelE-like toxin of type II toxin-antitoxin system HigB
MLHAAGRLTDLRVPPGNRLHQLERDRAGQHSISINDQWRICFVWRDGNAYHVEIVKQERGISPEMALRLGYAFGTTPDFWLNLQSEFDLRVVRNQKEAKVKNQVRPLEVHS